MDALMFIKFVRMMLIISSLIAVFGFVVLFPINATSDYTKMDKSTNETYVDGLNVLTLSAIPPKSNRMLAHMFGVLINSVLVFFFTFKLYRTYMKYRLRARTLSNKIENYTVMVRNVPPSLSDKNLNSFFNELFPGKVLHVIRSHLTPDLDTKLIERDGAMRAVEKSYAVHCITGERPTNKDKFLIGNVVDSIEWHTERFNNFTLEAETLQKSDKNERANVVFVVFNDLAAASQCSTAVLDSRNRLVPEPAPEPRDLVWTHFKINAKEHFIRSLLVDIFMILLTLFWTIPVTFVAGLSNLDTLRETGAFAWLADFLSLNATIKGFVSGFLPTLAMIIFFALLVKIIYAVVTLSGIYSRAEISRGVMNKYYVFQVFNILLIYSISGAIIKALDPFINMIKDNPGSIVDLLAHSLPKQSTFFINYIMLLSLTGHAKNLWRPGPLIVRWIKHKFLSKTAREYREAEAPGPFAYAEGYTMHLLVFTILLVYSTLSPFIMIFGVVYYALAYVSNKYNVVYVNVPNWEGGGLHWPCVFHRVYFALILYQIILAGVFGIYKFIPGAIVSFISIAASVVVMQYTKNEFKLSSNFLPLRVALERSDFFTELSTPRKGDLSDNIVVDSPSGSSRPTWSEESSDNNNNTPQSYFQPSLQPITSQPELVIAPNKTAKINPGAGQSHPMHVNSRGTEDEV